METLLTLLAVIVAAIFFRAAFAKLDSHAENKRFLQNGELFWPQEDDDAR